MTAKKETSAEKCHYCGAAILPGETRWCVNGDCSMLECRKCREGDPDEAPGKCVTCGTPCVADGSLAVICPNCDWKERAVALLKALGDLGEQDLYTDAHEYRSRVGAMQRLCHAADLMAAGVEVSMADIEEYAAETEDGEEN